MGLRILVYRKGHMVLLVLINRYSIIYLWYVVYYDTVPFSSYSSDTDLYGLKFLNRSQINSNLINKKTTDYERVHIIKLIIGPIIRGDKIWKIVYSAR